MIPELERDLRETMHAEWASQITDVENALLQAQEEKKHAISEADEQKVLLNNDIHTLEQMYRKLDIALKEL